MDRAGWEDVAEQWLQWSRAPRHDEYWYYRDAFFEVIVPPPGKATLEVGCGEGRVARDLAARGHNVLAVDGWATLLEAARTADPAGRYAAADAAALPFADRSIDLAVAYNSLMDIDELDAAVREVARVLRSGARFCICLTHPILNAGGFAGDAPGAPLVLHHSSSSPGRLTRRSSEQAKPCAFSGGADRSRRTSPPCQGPGSSSRGFESQ